MPHGASPAPTVLHSAPCPCLVGGSTGVPLVTLWLGRRDGSSETRPACRAGAVCRRVRFAGHQRGAGHQRAIGLDHDRTGPEIDVRVGAHGRRLLEVQYPAADYLAGFGVEHGDDVDVSVIVVAPYRLCTNRRRSDRAAVHHSPSCLAVRAPLVPEACRRTWWASRPGPVRRGPAAARAAAPRSSIRGWPRRGIWQTTCSCPLTMKSWPAAGRPLHGAPQIN